MQNSVSMLPLALLVALACPRAPVEAAIAVPAAGPCPTNQQVLFSCPLAPVKGGKAAETLSICGLPESTAARVQVRWGPTGGQQTIFPDAAIPAAEVFKYSRYTRPQTTYLALAFSLSGVTYTVYDDEDMGQTARGMRMERVGAAQEDRACTGGVTGSLMSLENLLPDSGQE